MNEVMSMEERIARKLNSNKAFTLAETLLAVLILLMVSTIVATGIPVARNAYEKVVLASNAEVLLSTTISTLRNEIGTAQTIETPEPASGESAKTGTIITYYNAARGAYSKIYVGTGGNQEIMFQRYFSKDGLGVAYNATQMISSKASTADLYVTYSSVTYTNGIITFSGLSVNRENGTEGLASREELSIRVISFTGD